MSATPRPWELTRYAGKMYVIDAERTDGLATRKAIAAILDNYADADDNADFILRAVNAHDALVEAAQAVCDEWTHDGRCRMCSLRIGELRDALRLARGEL